MSLEKLGRDDEAFDAMKGIASAGQMTPTVYDKLRERYAVLKDKPATFEAWIASLKPKHVIEKIKKQLQAEMVDVPFEPFVLESHSGGKVKSASFKKDEIVVIDFWALWCAPCIAALDGMQMAVDLYANDPTVKFYFVITQDEKLMRYGKRMIFGIWRYCMMRILKERIPGMSCINLCSREHRVFLKKPSLKMGVSVIVRKDTVEVPVV